MKQQRKQPTLHEAWAAMNGSLTRMRTVLMALFGKVTDTGQSLTTHELLVVAVDDWLEKHAGTAIDADARLRILLSFFLQLRITASQFDGCNESCRVSHLLAVADFRYVCIRGQGLDWVFDLQTDQKLDALDVPQLTSLTCNLAILLLRVLDRADKMRTDALPAPNHRPAPGEAAAGRPAGAAGP